MQAIQKLHQLGALDDYLKPVQQSGLLAAETLEASTSADEGGKSPNLIQEGRIMQLLATGS